MGVLKYYVSMRCVLNVVRMTCEKQSGNERKKEILYRMSFDSLC